MPEENQEKAEEKSEEHKKTKRISLEEFEKKVMELAESGLTSEKIGENLRKQGIHPQEFKKKISQVLGSKYISPDMKNIGEKLDKIEKHYGKNKKDKRAMRDKEKVSARLRRLKKYLQA